VGIRSPRRCGLLAACFLVAPLFGVWAVGCASSPLFDAVKRGDTAAVGALIDAGASANEQAGGRQTPLHVAAAAGDARMVVLLVQRGADVDARDVFGDTPLHLAALRGRVAVIRGLAEAGADLEIRSLDRTGMGALDRTGMGALDVQGGTPLVYAARAGRLDAARALVEAGARVPAPEAVSEAARLGHLELARFLNQATMQAPLAEREATGGALPEPYARRLAAVIGVSRYASWSPLEGARRDAERVAEALRDQGFDSVIELYDEQAARSKVLELLGLDLRDAAGDDDLVFVYFAGHGQTETLADGSRRGYLVPFDGRPENAYASAISMDVLRDLSNRLRARHVYFAIDSCYSGLGLVDSRGVRRQPGGRRARAIQMITAGTEGQLAVERGGLGLFTTYLLRAIAGGEADRDGDGVVTGSEIGEFVAPQVEQQTRGRQTPRFGHLDGTGEISFHLRARLP